MSEAQSDTIDQRVASMPRAAAMDELAAIIKHHEVTAAELFSLLPMNDKSARSNNLSRVLGYIGATFVFAGIVAFIAMQWDTMNSLMHVLITLGTGTVLFIVAALGIGDQRFRASTTPMFFAAGLLQPLGLMIAFDEYGGGGDEQVAALITLGSFGLQNFLVYLKRRLLSLLVIVIAMTSGFWAILLDLLDLEFGQLALTLGAGWMLTGLALRQSRQQVLVPALLFFGCWGVLLGVWDIVEHSAFEVFFVVVACALVYLGVWAKSRALNLAATLGILAYTAYFTGTYFADSVGWPLALIVVGILMIAIGALALRIDRKYIKTGG